MDQSENSWNKHTCFLASPICLGQAQWGEDKCIKGGSPEGLRPLLWGWPALMTRRWNYPLIFLIKLSCNTGLPIQIFAAVRQNWENYSLPGHIWCQALDVTWLKQPKLCPSEAETKRSRSPPWWKLTLWKLKAKETQRSRSDKKPSLLETGTTKTNSAESSHSLVSDSRRLQLR